MTLNVLPSTVSLMTLHPCAFSSRLETDSTLYEEFRSCSICVLFSLLQNASGSFVAVQPESNETTAMIISVLIIVFFMVDELLWRWSE